MSTQNKSHQKTVIVLGCSRSGTSMTAGILDIVGVKMGNLRDPAPENPKGYFEDKDFLSLCDDMLIAADPAAHSFNPPPVQDILKTKDRFDTRIKRLLKKRALEAGRESWGWKVTITCFTIRLFLPYLKSPHFVIVFRNHLDIAKSMVKYTKNKSFYQELDLLQALELTDRYYSAIYGFLGEYNTLPKYFISFDDIIKDPERELEGLAGFLNIPVTAISYEEVRRFVTPREKMRSLKRKYRSLEMARRLYKLIKKPNEVFKHMWTGGRS